MVLEHFNQLTRNFLKTSKKNLEIKITKNLKTLAAAFYIVCGAEQFGN